MSLARDYEQRNNNRDVGVAKSPIRVGILYRGNRVALAVRRGMDLRCTQCGSAGLKKVSLAYEEGLFKTKSRGRLLGLVFGNSSPSFVVGGTTGKGTHQSQLSSLLKPPEKRSYLRVTYRFGVSAFMGFVAYVIFVIVSTPPVSSLPIKLYVAFAPIVFCLLLFLAWRHNHLVYPMEFARWDRSFICQRCGAVSEHNIP